MKTSKMLELVENLKVGEKVVIEKFKDHLFVEKKYSESSDNINKHGVDLSILNEEDWFYVETQLFRWIAKGNIYTEKSEKAIHYNLITYDFWENSDRLCRKDEISLLRKATPEDLAPFFEKYPMYAPVKVGDLEPFFEKYPMYAPVKVGDWGLFYDNVEDIEYEIEEELITIWKLKNIDAKYGYSTSSYWYKHFFKVSENETIAEIKERFLKEN